MNAALMGQVPAGAAAGFLGTRARSPVDQLSAMYQPPGPSQQGRSRPPMSAPMQQAPQGRGGIDIAQIGAMILAANGNPLGQIVMQQMGDQRQAQAQQQARQQQMQAQQAAEWEMFQRQQQYRRDNPEPDQLERYMRGANIDPRSPEGQAMFRNAAQNRANPIQGVPFTNPDGSGGIQFVRPGAMGGAAPRTFDTLPEGAVPIDDEGGAGPAAAPNSFSDPEAHNAWQIGGEQWSPIGRIGR